MIIDTGNNVTIIRKDLAQSLAEKLIWTPPRVTFQTVTVDNIDIYGKMNLNIKFGNAAYLHTVYVADISDPFILGLDFLQDHGFMLDFRNSVLRSSQEDVTTFKIGNNVESNYIIGLIRTLTSLPLDPWSNEKTRKQILTSS